MDVQYKQKEIMCSQVIGFDGLPGKSGQTQMISRGTQTCFAL